MRELLWKGIDWRAVARAEGKWALGFVLFWLILLDIVLILICSSAQSLGEIGRQIALHPQSGPDIHHVMAMFGGLVFLALVVIEITRLIGTVHRRIAAQDPVLAKKIQAYALIFGGIFLVGGSSFLLHFGTGSRPVPPPKPPVFHPFVGTRYRALIHEKTIPGKLVSEYTKNIVGPAQVKSLGAGRYLVQFEKRGMPE
ncbi:hypothetical protein MQE22_08370 [Acidithiobacillus sp. YTS05]|nr:hypothetical protein MQE22_08370 [Acidithiobacillus sp. YTS05]